MSGAKDELAEIRKQIAEADEALAAALDARARAIQSFRSLREDNPDGYFTLPRDTDVLGHVREVAKQFPAERIEPIVREVLSASDAMVAPLTVSYLGPEGGFPHVAARRGFGSAAELRPVDSVLAVLEDVQRGRASFGVVPLETSSDGALTATLQGLVDTEVKVCRELTLPATYHLLSGTGNASDVEKIYAAPGAIAHCERFLRTQYPRATVLDVPSGEVAAQLAREDHGAAAVGTEITAETHELRIVRERVEDQSGVETRFAVVGQKQPSRTGTDRTVIALAVQDTPGALYKALQPFADRGINLTRLESRPATSSAWRYLFFVEMDGHVTDRSVLTALEELRSASSYLKILGSYPRPEGAA